ncbi:hypothetical protein BGZ61DRAFT_461200 [Ilyonectria robusta]|uniref:uncharacterized protein n=1 Tax=Ilyonectria robusta TaxID=1079257 RepID=UPI001E8DEA1A|nr:uncharacterized protein BGZ61DRAFT_461200 [Ilyonectria robusta]KAH8667843.1 hypothetical protein BGZ61DRAFT_461200 [Ilyonectria robusta]
MNERRRLTTIHRNNYSEREKIRYFDPHVLRFQSSNRNYCQPKSEQKARVRAHSPVRPDSGSIYQK